MIPVDAVIKVMISKPHFKKKHSLPLNRDKFLNPQYDMPWSLVSPASRGIGFHLTRHLLQTTKIPVVATARKDVEGVKKSILQDLPDVESDRLTVLELDFTSKFSPHSTYNFKIRRTSSHLHRRNFHPARGGRRKIHVHLRQPPPPCLRHPRHSLSRESTLTTRPRAANPHLRHQHHRPLAAHEALHALPTFQIHQTLHVPGTRTRPPAPRRLAHDGRARWLNNR